MNAAIRRTAAIAVPDVPGIASESPFWDTATASLTWVETREGRVHTWQPATGVASSRDFAGAVGCAIPRRGGGVVVSVDARLVTVRPGGEERPLVELGDPSVVRLNDGGCDSDGILWVGTMALDLSPGGGELFRVEPDGTAKSVMQGVGISNGVGFGLDGSMYYIDSLAGGIDVLDAAPPATRRRFAEIPSDGSSPLGMTVPDGLTLDAEDHIWVAVFGAGEVRRYSPEGVVEEIVDVPHPAPTSCAFGGPDLRTLFITSGAESAEHLFASRPGVTGRAPYAFAG